MRRSLTVFWLFAGIALVASTRGSASAQGATPSPVGAWQFELMPNAGSTTTSPIDGLISLTSDGLVIETDLGEIATSPAGATPSIAPATMGQGIWQPGPVFGRLFVRFISLTANPNATIRAKRVLTMTVAPNSRDDKFQGGYSFVIIDPAGHAISSGSGAVSGERIPHPALP